MRMTFRDVMEARRSIVAGEGTVEFDCTHAMKLSDDIQSARLLWLKGCLFVLAGALAAAGLLAENWSLRTAVLLGLAIWCFCRAYYFAFYVVQHYIDPEFKFAGLTSVAQYLWRKRKQS